MTPENRRPLGAGPIPAELAALLADDEHDQEHDEPGPAAAENPPPTRRRRPLGEGAAGAYLYQ